MKKLILAFLLTLPFAATKADVFQSYNFSFSGPNASNTRTEILSGSFTLNQTALLIPNPGSYMGYAWYAAYNPAAIAAVVTAFSGTISGSDGYNGALQLSDLNGFYATGTGLDASKSLIGQAGLVDFGFSGWRYNAQGERTDVNGFTLSFFGFAKNAYDPNKGTDYKLLSGSISPVPEPSSYVLGFAGLVGMVGFASSRKKKAEAAVAV